MEQVVVAAFSEEQASRLSGVRVAQLRNWDRNGFYHPSYAAQGGGPFSRIYSFLDIASLRVLNVLRNQFGVSLQHLREASAKLGGLAQERWIGTKLWVVKKQVVWQEPGTDKPQAVVSGQYVVPVVLEEVLSDTKYDVEQFNRRDDSVIGRVERSRYINHNAPVIAGTRIPVRAIKEFAEAGYSNQQIIGEYPDLTEQDVKAALAHSARTAA